MTSRWDTARLALRRAGPEALLNVLLRSGLRPLGAWQTLVFFERDASAEIPEVRAAVAVETHIAAADELRRHRAAMEAAGVHWDRVLPRLAQGDVCAIALSGGRLVHASWITVTSAWIPELHATIRPAADEAYAYDGFTLPEMRGSQLQPAVAAEILRWAYRRGRARVTFYVRGSDPSAARIASKMGARRSRVIRCFRLKGGKGTWVRGLASGGGPHFEFPPTATLRSLGPLGLWVSEGPR